MVDKNDQCQREHGRLKATEPQPDDGWVARFPVSVRVGPALVRRTVTAPAAGEHLLAVKGARPGRDDLELRSGA